MIKTAEEMKTVFKEALQNGKGRTEIQHVFMKEELGGQCRLFARITLEPGTSVGKHRHGSEEEIYYLLEGQGTVTDNGKSRVVKSGDAILTGNGGEHSIENTGDQPLVFLAVILLYA